MQQSHVYDRFYKEFCDLALQRAPSPRSRTFPIRFIYLDRWGGGGCWDCLCCRQCWTRSVKLPSSSRSISLTIMCPLNAPSFCTLARENAGPGKSLLMQRWIARAHSMLWASSRTPLCLSCSISTPVVSKASSAHSIDSSVKFNSCFCHFCHSRSCVISTLDHLYIGSSHHPHVAPARLRLGRLANARRNGQDRSHASTGQRDRLQAARDGRISGTCSRRAPRRSDVQQPSGEH